MPSVETFALIWPGTVCLRSQTEFELPSTPAPVWPQSPMNSHRLACTLKEFQLSSTLALVWPLTLMCSYRLSCPLKVFELSPALALVWPLTLMRSHRLLCALKEFEQSTLALLWPAVYGHFKMATLSLQS